MNIYDVAEISIIDQDEVVYGPVGTASVLEVDVLTENQVQLIQVVYGQVGTASVLEVDVLTESPVQLIEVVSEGPQGPPGDKNVYAQLNSPAEQYHWGPEDAGKIWIKVDI